MLEFIKETVKDETIIGKFNTSMLSVATVMWFGSFLQVFGVI